MTQPDLRELLASKSYTWRLAAMLRFLKDHRGECLGDHPEWIAHMKELLEGPSATEQAEFDRALSTSGRDGVLEEAAKVCDDQAFAWKDLTGEMRTYYDCGCFDSAAAIRVLKSVPPPAGGKNSDSGDGDFPFVEGGGLLRGPRGEVL